GHGVTVIDLPPFGRLSADTHFAPLRFTAALQSVRINDLTRIVGSGGTDALVDRVQADALHQVVPFAIHVLLASLAATLILSVLVYRKRWRAIGVALLVTLLMVG